MSPDLFLIFFEVFWYNKMNKYGLQDFKNQEIMEFGDFDVQYDEIGILLDQNEAEKINKAIKPII